MIELNEEQRRELDGVEPARARDARTNNVYVLVRVDVYEQMRVIIDGFTRRAGWDDPEMNVYDELYGDKT